MLRRSRRAALIAGIVSLAVLSLVASSAMAWNATEGFSASGFTAEALNQDGTPDTQAGDHPYIATTEFSLSGADVKDIDVDLPPGFLGDPQAIPQCPIVRLTAIGEAGNPLSPGNPCPPDTIVGEVTLEGSGYGPGPKKEHIPVYNLIPEPGFPSEFGFNLFGSHPVILYGTVRTGGDYGITVVTPGILQATELSHISFTFWGVPADHNGPGPFSRPGGNFGGPSGANRNTFLTTPVNCAGGSGATTTKLRVDSWQYFGEFHAYEAFPPPLTGCTKLSFSPTLTITPDTTQVDSPTGLTIDMKLPWSNEPEKLVTPELKNTILSFPQGLAISPTAADGLQGCTDAQFAKDDNVPAACPNASQVATVQITSPLLATPLPGQVYLGSPLCSPCSSADAASGRVFRLFLQAQTSGALVKLEGAVSPNPVTGQLTATFYNTPQLPFTDLQIHVKAGSRAAFVNPPTCGPQTTTSDLTPWSAPYTPDSDPASTYNTDWDGAGGACPAGGEPFDPSFTAGMVVPLANGFSPFTLSFSRPDGNQPLSAFKMELPPGLLGMLSTVPLCPEPQAAQGTCSEASKIGTTEVGAGSGTHPFFLGGNIYLTGPYKGAPFGVSVVVPAIAGPYNLGNVIVRASINVDPTDAHVIVTTDPLPQILSGVPTRLRTVSVTLDRPGFMFNPTNCTPTSVTATLGGGQEASAKVSSPFNTAGCKNLPFSPKFSATTIGKPSRANGVGLDVKIKEVLSGQANIKSVKVDLPKQLPSRLTTLQKACTAKVFDADPANCPPASIVGIAKAITPVLSVPVMGPVYFVSHGGEAFPSLIIVLQGDGVRVDLIGSTFISKTGITSSTFRTVPDVPITSFELYLPPGKYSALAANGNLCAKTLTMPTRVMGQNGAVLKLATKIIPANCSTAKTTSRNAKTTRHAETASKHTSHGGR